ncbi:thioredoxin family protein [Marinobacterium sedimentorum]|uniref:thioredoxin family protein n=1 Tax=Marinobacterium sedimentorum TaxID=2927804 RepID=UPI0020C71E33|nr:thioredoxin family protein [Marinobacterium sedimentorum]MCP8690420.1 thioredoxin family protein [Marinobacterium sedimentorum]
MSLTASTMMPLGTPAPDFNLLDVRSGQQATLQDCAGAQGVLIAFICNHCPYVHHIEDELIELAWDYQARGIAVVAISANDVESSHEDGPLRMQDRASAKGYPFPYLYDETQEVARAYDAACTPDLFLFDGQLKCVYRGQFDASRLDNGIEVTGNDLRRACDALLTGDPIDPNQTPSVGCNIKWKTGT